MAFKPAVSEDQPGHSLSYIEGLRQNFQSAIAFVRDAENFAAERSTASTEDALAKQSAISQADMLAGRATNIHAVMALPDVEVLRRFCGEIGITELLATLDNLTRSEREEAIHREMEAGRREMEERIRETLELRIKVEWLEVFGIGFYVTAMLALIVKWTPAAIIGGAIALALAAWLMRPWRRKPSKSSKVAGIPALILIFVSYILALLLLAHLVR